MTNIEVAETSCIQKESVIDSKVQRLDSYLSRRG